MFPTVKNLDDGHSYFDGGVAHNVDIATAVNHCKDLMGGDESKVTIDIYLNGGGTFRDADVSKYNSLKQGLRYLEIRSFYSSMDMVIRAKDSYKNVNFRYLIAPTSKLETGIIPFNFDHEEIEHNIAKGVADAKQVMELGEGKSFDSIMGYYKAKVIDNTAQDYGEYLETFE